MNTELTKLSYVSLLSSNFCKQSWRRQRQENHYLQREYSKTSIQQHNDRYVEGPYFGLKRCLCDYPINFMERNVFLSFACFPLVSSISLLWMKKRPSVYQNIIESRGYCMQIRRRIVVTLYWRYCCSEVLRARVPSVTLSVTHIHKCSVSSTGPQLCAAVTDESGLSFLQTCPTVKLSKIEQTRSFNILSSLVASIFLQTTIQPKSSVHKH
jgi:hypothetical protein